MALLQSSAALLGLAAFAPYAQARLIDFEDLLGTAESTKIWQQYNGDNLIFGMVSVVTNGTLANECSKFTGGNCQYWYSLAVPPTNDPDQNNWARPLLVHIGGAAATGFVGPAIPDGTCGAGGTPKGIFPAWYCTACCNGEPLGGSNGANRKDVGFYEENIGQRFLTDAAGLSNPNTIKVFAIAYLAGGCTTCGGAVLDVDCQFNAPKNQDTTLCEAWLIQGWSSRNNAADFLSAPNDPGAWNVALDYQLISAQPLANLEASGRDVRQCDPLRVGGPACTVDYVSPANCCPETNCGRRSQPWCSITEFGPDGARHAKDGHAADGLASVFQLSASPLNPINFITVEWAGTKVSAIGLAFDLFESNGTLTSPETLAPFATRPLTADNTVEPSVTDAPTGTAMVVADPHFVGFSGGAFDVMGEPNHIYNIISDSEFALNARFISGFTHHSTTYLGELGVRVGESSAVFDPASCTVDVNDGLELPRAYGTYALSETSQLLMEHDWIQLSTPNFVVDMHCVAKRASAHFDMRLRYLKKVGGPSSPHGLLGQTADGKFRHSTGHQGEGVIEGVYTDYEVSHMTGTDFKYNKFGSAVPAGQRALLEEASWVEASSFSS